MTSNLPLHISPAVARALEERRPVVALESTLIAHGLPWPQNLETARDAEAAVTAEGAVPATIAVLAGRVTVGLSEAELAELARAPGTRKASRRDLGAAVAQKARAATTVSATMAVAHLAGIRVFATGGLGGVHPVSHEAGPQTWDVSADLTELARTPVAVVCAGAKSVLDLAATLEVLETYGVPVLGQGTDTFPAFYLASSGLPVSARVETAAEAAAALAAHWALGGMGAVLALPLPAGVALDTDELTEATRRAERLAREQKVSGPALTPFLLARLADLTGGRTLRANRELIVANARLAARVAGALLLEGEKSHADTGDR